MNAKEYFQRTIMEQIGFFRCGIGPVVPCFATTLEIELSNFCNLDCPFCCTSALTRNRTRLPLGHFRKLIDYLDGKDLKPRINFAGDGEPFTHKKALDFVAYAKEKGYHIQIITNGILCAPEKSAALVAMGLDRIQFSIDSIYPETYAKMRRAKGPSAQRQNFEKAMYHTLEYARLNYEAGEPTTVSVMAVQTDYNRSEAETFQAFWYSVPVHNVYLSPLYTVAGNAAKVFEEAEHAKYRGAMEDKPLCLSPFILLSVKADGKVLACAHDADAVYPIGNVIENGDPFDVANNGDPIERTIEIDRLWNNARIQELRASLLTGQTSHFEAIGHDCATCNCPLGDGNVEAYMTGLRSPKIQKIWQSMEKKPRRLDNGKEKHRRLLELLPGYAPKSKVTGPS